MLLGDVWKAFDALELPERLQFLGLAVVETLANIDERRHRRVQRSKRARDERADVRTRHCLRRLVTGMPLELMP